MCVNTNDRAINTCFLTSAGYLLFHRFFGQDSLAKLSNHWKIMQQEHGGGVQGAWKSVGCYCLTKSNNTPITRKMHHGAPRKPVWLTVEFNRP
jgi:hypothetical protein